MKRVLLLSICGLLVVSSSSARKQGRDLPARTTVWNDLIPPPPDDEPLAPHVQLVPSAATTLMLASYRFDNGFTCTGQGWTTVDLTTQSGDYWHVDDFAPSNTLGDLGPSGTSTGGIAFNPIQGAKSMWMAQRIPPAGPVDFVHCGYLALPGYGNGWNQSFCSKDCLNAGGSLDIAFKLKFDSEASYDGTFLEYTTDCAGNQGWIAIDGGTVFGAGWTGPDSILVTGPYAVPPGTIKVRLHFTSDTAYSNQDGHYPGFGVAVDSLSWEGRPVEDFEGEAVGAHAGNDWQSCNTPGFGNYLALFKQSTGANYEDECLDNVSCYWAAIQGSTEFYGCGLPSQPTQKIVPHVNVRGEYISNEIWSPVIPFTGSGSEFRLRYTVYRDLPLDNLIFHVWHVRTIGANGCPGVWKDRNFVYFGDSKDWAVMDNAVGSKLDLNTGVSMQAAIGVLDMCPWWCGVFGTGACHSPAPYIDRVQIVRVDRVGPQWDVRDLDTFQDTFASDGTITGTARADNASDTKPWSSPTITPGDSAVVLYLVDPKYAGTGTNSSGLSNDPVLSTYIGPHKTKKQAYMYVSVWPQGQPLKSGAPLSEGPGGTANRYPFMGTVVANGVTWTKIRMDYTYSGPIGCQFDCVYPLIPNRFNVDLNDNLFTPGDTICYFYGATSPDGTTYFSQPIGTTTDMNVAAANPMELTIFPAGGYRRGGNILYVDGADDLNNDIYFYGAWFALGMRYYIDRYDVRSPSSGAGNRLGGRVINVAQQLNACYREIIWDTGPHAVTLGDGSGDPEKCDDYTLLNTFLGNLTNRGGVYLGGDDVATALDSYSGTGAVTFRSTYLPFTLLNNNHRKAPSNFRISPTIVPWPGRFFTDSFFIFGGCAEINDFDVIGASGTSQVQMSYNTASNPNGAVVSNVNGNAVVVMSGFSVAYLRDNELDGIFDRAKFLRDIIIGLGATLPAVVPVAGGELRSHLAQNYPNPFNPQTTIAFSIKARGHVALAIYDVGGRLVRTLANETRAAGAYQLTWDGRDQSGSAVASGVYFYKLTAGDFSQTKKMVMLK